MLGDLGNISDRAWGNHERRRVGSGHWSKASVRSDPTSTDSCLQPGLPVVCRHAPKTLGRDHRDHPHTGGIVDDSRRRSACVCQLKRPRARTAEAIEKGGMDQLTDDGIEHYGVQQDHNGVALMLSIMPNS